MSIPYEKYTSGDYARDNPDWDSSDSPWKAGQVLALLQRNRLQPDRIVEVGCGAGRVLTELARQMPAAAFKGYEIAPDAARFWTDVASDRVSFEVADFTEKESQGVEVALLLDVIEHVPDPFAFLLGVARHARHIVLHIPLDLSAASVLREQPLLYVRKKVGHIHYFTKGLALALLQECGFEVLDCRYTGAWSNLPGRGWRTRLASLPRRLARLIDEDLAVRLFGGDTLIVLVRTPPNS
jgi:SAM-dependent methyltransferase